MLLRRQPCHSGLQPVVPVGLRVILVACVLLGLAGPAAVQAARVPVPEEAAARLAAEVAADGQVVSAPWAQAGWSPDQLVSLRGIDLLLDLQLTDTDLGRTPADAAASAPQQAAVDVRSLSPGVPENPLFPGYGLSYEPPAVAVRPTLPDSVRTPAEQEARNDARRWQGGTGSWLGFEPREDGAPNPLQDAAAWASAHRVGLLMGMGLTVVLAAAAVALLRRAAAPARPSASSGARRRRRRGAEHPTTPRR